MHVNLADLPEGTPLWIILALVLIPSLLTFSEKAAKISGPLGALARWWQGRQQRAIEREHAVAGTRLSLYEAELSELRALVDDIRDRMESAETRHRIEIEEIHAERDLYADWSAYQARWWRPKHQWLAEQGITLPPPPYPTFADFRKEWARLRAKSGP